MLIASTTKAAFGRQTGPFTAAQPVAAAHRSTDTLDMLGASMSFDRNEEIFGESEPAEYLYKVISGAVRTYQVLDDGRRQVGAFYLPGDFFGLEHGDVHSCSCEAISNATVLVFKRSAVLTLANHDGSVARRLWGMTARELQHAQRHMLLLIKSAAERLASFLFEMAERMRASNEFDLPMSRQDIADYLGLTIETVSRTLSEFEATGMIALPTSRRISVRNRSALGRLNV